MEIQDKVRIEPVKGQGVRTLKLEDQLPDCEIKINSSAYDFLTVVSGKRVVDIGCGYGRNRKIVESVGGEWDHHSQCFMGKPFNNEYEDHLDSITGFVRVKLIK